MENMMKVDHRYTFVLLILTLTTLSISCAQLKDLASLRSLLIEQFKQKNVEVKIVNGRALHIGFIYSEFGELEPDLKKTKTKEIANFVKSHYRIMEGIDRISIAFVKNNDLVILNSNSTENFVFQKSQLD
jgi:hypothetical protein